MDFMAIWLLLCWLLLCWLLGIVDSFVRHAEHLPAALAIDAVSGIGYLFLWRWYRRVTR